MSRLPRFFALSAFIAHVAHAQADGCRDSKVALKTTSGGITGKRGEAQLTLKRE
jgi:hypothetical protein